MRRRRRGRRRDRGVGQPPLEGGARRKRDWLFACCERSVGPQRGTGAMGSGLEVLSAAMRALRAAADDSSGHHSSPTVNRAASAARRSVCVSNSGSRQPARRLGGTKCRLALPERHEVLADGSISPARRKRAWWRQTQRGDDVVLLRDSSHTAHPAIAVLRVAAVRAAGVDIEQRLARSRCPSRAPARLAAGACVGRARGQAPRDASARTRGVHAGTQRLDNPCTRFGATSKPFIAIPSQPQTAKPKRTR